MHLGSILAPLLLLATSTGAHKYPLTVGDASKHRFPFQLTLTYLSDTSLYGRNLQLRPQQDGYSLVADSTSPILSFLFQNGSIIPVSYEYQDYHTSYSPIGVSAYLKRTATSHDTNVSDIYFAQGPHLPGQDRFTFEFAEEGVYSLDHVRRTPKDGSNLFIAYLLCDVAGEDYQQVSFMEFRSEYPNFPDGCQEISATTPIPPLGKGQIPS